MEEKQTTQVMSDEEYFLSLISQKNIERYNKQNSTSLKITLMPGYNSSFNRCLIQVSAELLMDMKHLHGLDSEYILSTLIFDNFASKGLGDHLVVSEYSKVETVVDAANFLPVKVIKFYVRAYSEQDDLAIALSNEITKEFNQEIVSCLLNLANDDQPQYTTEVDNSPEAQLKQLKNQFKFF